MNGTTRILGTATLSFLALGASNVAEASRRAASTIHGEVRILTDLWTPMEGTVPVDGAVIDALEIDANGESVARDWTRSVKTFSFDDAFLANGNLAMGGDWTWKPNATSGQETLVLGLPEAERMTLDSVAAGSFQHGQLNEFWTWTGNGTPFAFDPFEAWVTVLNTRASQHAVDASKGWGLAGTGQTLAIYVEDAVDLTDDSGLSFSIVAMEGACIGTQAVVRTDSLDAVTAVHVDGRNIELSIRGGLDAGWNWFEVVQDPTTGICGALDSSAHGSVGAGSTTLGGMGRTAGTGTGSAPDVTSTTPGHGSATCEPAAPKWDAPPANPRCPNGGGEYVGTDVFASCESGPALLCAGSGGSVSDSWSYTVSANFSVGFWESVQAGLGISISRTLNFTVQPGHCARPYTCEKGKVSTYVYSATSTLHGYTSYGYKHVYCELDQLAYAPTCEL